MTKIDIISGFLGAGKTTLIKKLIDEAFKGEKIVLIENEFGEIGIDSGFLKDAGVEITEMNSGCICCSLVGDFGTALKQVIDDHKPDRIIIEPSGVGKLSDVIKAVIDVDAADDVFLNSATTVVDVMKCKMYIKNFGEFFNNQVENANTIILSRTQNANESKLKEATDLLSEYNEEATIITTPWEEITGETILEAIDGTGNLEEEMMLEELHHHHEHKEECGCGEHHEHKEECGCGGHHHHEHKEECGCGGHHHHEHKEECGCGEHHHHKEECGCEEHHHHEHGEECSCGCGGHHHADEIFTSWGQETGIKFEENQLKLILEELAYESDKYGMVLRAKGILNTVSNEWLYFDLVPGEYEIRKGKPDYTGKLCVIGSNLNEELLKGLFNI